MLRRMLFGALIGLALGVAIPIVGAYISGSEGAINVTGWFWFLTIPSGLMLGVIFGAVSATFD